MKVSDTMIKHPAFNDSHLHLLGLGYVETMVDLSSYTSIADTYNITLDQNIIFGRGWHQDQFIEKRYPTKEDLNTISTEKPVIFLRVCGHVLVCNDKAMAVAGVTSQTPQVSGGAFNYDTGVFSEDAMRMIKDILEKPDKAAVKEMLLSGQKQLFENGITQCASDDFSILDVPYEMVLEALQELYASGEMTIRLTEQVNLPKVSLLKDFLSKNYHNLHFGNFKMGPLKLLADGSLGGRTAFLNAPYTDDSSTRGIKVFDDDKLEELIYLADSHGMDVAIHAIGDAIIDTILDTFKKVTERTGRTNHRHSLIHAQLATKKQIKRMKQMGIMPIVQPIFINSDLPIIESRLGKARTNESYLFHTMLKAGLNVGFSTDAPVEPVNPFYNIYTAMTRKSIKHPQLDHFDNDGLFTYQSALDCYTINNAYHSYDEDNVFNDYIVLNKDPKTAESDELLTTSVLETYLDGTLVYKKQ
ncbi:MAG: amidohydrolase [Candidatus Izimaplasma sp.]|nr:amidohydrolase [Candidatus Izimaplasma bacterium]